MVRPIDHTRPDEVREEIPALERRPEPAAAIDVSAGDRLTRGAVVFVNRIDERQKRRRQRGVVVVRAFAIAPSVVAAAPIRRFVVDLFPAP